MSGGDDDPGQQQLRRTLPKRTPNYNLYVPLVWAPVIPCIRLGLRRRVQPATLTKITIGAIFVALGHAGSVMINAR